MQSASAIMIASLMRIADHWVQAYAHRHVKKVRMAIHEFLSFSYISICSLLSIIMILVYLYKEPYRKECCNERKANCLACEQGISVKEFCRKILQNPIMMYSNRYPECKGSLKLSLLHFRKSLLITNCL